MIRVCMYCGHVFHPPNKWNPPIYEEQRRMKKGPVSHGLCPGCMKKHYAHLFE